MVGSTLYLRESLDNLVLVSNLAALVDAVLLGTRKSPLLVHQECKVHAGPHRCRRLVGFLYTYAWTSSGLASSLQVTYAEQEIVSKAEAGEPGGLESDMGDTWEDLQCR